MLALGSIINFILKPCNNVSRVIYLKKTEIIIDVPKFLLQMLFESNNNNARYRPTDVYSKPSE